MRISVWLTALSFLLAANIAFAGMDHVGTSAFNFLKIGVGGKAAAIGEAFTAISDDPTALYWNPGGLGFQKTRAINFTYTGWILNTKLHFLGVVIPVGNVGTAGLHIYSFSSGDIEETTIYKPHGTGRVFSTSNTAIGLSFARQLTDRYSVGLTLKYLSEKLALESAQSFALDVGSIFVISFDRNIRLGMVISNFGPDIKLGGLDLQTSVTTENSKLVEAELKTMSWPLPLLFRVGAAADLINRNGHRLTLSAEIFDPRDYQVRENVGLEYGMLSMFFLRAGYKLDYDEDSFVCGFGFRHQVTGLGNLCIDYAYSDMGRLQAINRISVGLSF